VLRGELKMVDTKFGCGKGLCGACTIPFVGQAVRSCQTMVRDADGRAITTIEGLRGRQADALRRPWTEIDVVQCGYCQSGQLMSACALLKATPEPTRQDIDDAMTGNICRRGSDPCPFGDRAGGEKWGRDLEHRAEKWVPVFGKKRCDNKSYSVRSDSEIGSDAAGDRKAKPQTCSSLTMAMARVSASSWWLAVSLAGWLARP
jgi:isoquinoline 1-oxidoreductase alpha subunit